MKWGTASDWLAKPPVTDLAWSALGALVLAGVVGVGASTHGVIQLSTMLRNDKQSEEVHGSRSVSHAPAPSAPTDPSPEREGDFVSELPVVAPSDLQFRYTANLAHEQRVSILQMQSELLKSDPKALGQTRITLQLRGDYRDVKNVWIALLAKFPGLTLQRLTVRHHGDAVQTSVPTGAGGALPPIDRDLDEATLELIQYTQPRAVRQ